MKSVLPFVILFFSTMVSAVVVMVILMLADPGLFGTGQSPGRSGPVAPPAPGDVRPNLPERAPATRNAANSAPAPVDSLALLRQNLPGLHDSLSAPARGPALASSAPVPAETLSAPDTGRGRQDSIRAHQRRAMAKVFDTMPAENAARILNNLPDSEVKEILLAVKKRQAAKILAALDPGRAAQILR